MTGSCAWIARGVNRNGHGGSFLFVSTFSVTLTVKLILKGGEGDLFEVGKINKVILCFNKPINSSSSIPGSKLWYGRCAICMYVSSVSSTVELIHKEYRFAEPH